MSPKISVIIPIYNTAPYLNRCIDSILSQDYPNIEIILVDDGSKDASPQIIDEYCSKYNNIIAIHKANSGQSEARRSGLNISTGEYVNFVDSDDWIPSNAISILFNRLKNENLDIVYGHYTRAYSDSTLKPIYNYKTGVFNKSQFKEIILNNDCKLTQYAAVSKREIWTDSVFPPHDTVYVSEDVLINLLLSYNVNRVGIYNDLSVYYYYAGNPNSVTNSRKSIKSYSVWKMYFSFIRKTIENDHDASKLHQLIKILEIDRLALYVDRSNLDKDDEWVKQVTNYKINHLPFKHKILLLSLKSRLLHSTINFYRTIKNKKNILD